MIIDLAKINRGGETESIHYGLACLANSSSIIKSWGDASFSSYTRSLIKPIQAMAVINSGLELSGELLAISVASHLGLPEQLKAVEKLLSQYNLSTEDLRCGSKSNSRGELKSPIYHNCSGKHAAILAAAKKQSWDLTNYFEVEHNYHALLVDELTRLMPGLDIKVAKDGCGLATFYMSIEAMAKLFASLVGCQSYEKIITTMNQFPFLIGGPRQIDSIIMNAFPNRFIAKVGAEGLVMVANLETKEALVLKMLDGSYRARGHVLLALLEELGWIAKKSIELDHNIYNSPGDIVGEIVPTI